ncbi:transposase [Nostoc sp. UHCC 0702]|nr:transposase [Nostoc sp. UHCC 0702]
MWLSTSELTGLPGMPKTIQNVRKKAHREGWQNRDRKQVGGGKEYHISSLPPETQEHLLATTAQTPQPQPAEETPAIASLPQPRKKGNKEDRIDAKLDILRQLETYCQQHQLQKIKGQHAFIAAYNSGQIAVDVATKQVMPSISPSSVQRWLKTLKTQSVDALGGRYGNRAGESKIEASPALRNFVIGILAEYPHASYRHIMKAICGRFEQELIPSQRTLDRWISKWKEENKELLTSIANPDRWKSKNMISLGSYSDGVDAINQLWEIDSTPADIMLEDGRHTLIGCIDVYSRRTKLLVVPRSKAVAIATLLRQCILDWGVPEVIKTDNGKDYTARHLQRLFANLDIKHRLCQPFQPWQKPHIERFFRTFAHDLVELLPGYIGHNGMALRKALSYV